MQDVIERNVAARTYRIVYRVPPLGDNGRRLIDAAWVKEATVLDAYDAAEAKTRLEYRLSAEGCFRSWMKPEAGYQYREERGPVMVEILDLGPA